MNKNTSQRWNIKLNVTPQERRKIQKEAIDLDMRISEYIKLKLLGDLPIQKNILQEKSA